MSELFRVDQSNLLYEASSLRASAAIILGLDANDDKSKGLFLKTFAVAAQELSPSPGLRASAAIILPWMSEV
ncbi:hypothetical protein VNO78_10123 [Psophocarpus tetragonolobus]|uniref:Uncharacterized protein n=1 Tax=Psophocarpus tetragonolobus TaxID=3891 RepID=A0AAN9XMH1_PSOTE